MQPYFFEWIALAENATPTTAVTPSALQSLIPMLLIFAIFYFLVLRPQSKKQKQHATFLKDMKKGDMVVTSSGIIGVIKNLSEKIVTLEIDNGVFLKVLRQQVSETAGNLKEEKT